MDGSTDASALAPPDIAGIVRPLGTLRRFAIGAVLFHEGDAPDAMYVVLTGTVEIRRRDRLIETVGDGQALGILSLLDGDARTVTALARTEVEAVAIGRPAFRATVEGQPHFAWYIMDELAHRLRMTNAAL
jgi:CRP-like cAMP-binding protein